MTLTDSPAYTVISSPRALVSYMRSTAHETDDDLSGCLEQACF